MFTIIIIRFREDSVQIYIRLSDQVYQEILLLRLAVFYLFDIVINGIAADIQLSGQSIC